MKTKKQFKMPQVEVIKCDSKDVITNSTNYASTSSYSIDSIKNFFNIKV